MAVNETMKTILIYVWRSKDRNNLRSSQRKCENLRTAFWTAWLQVNEEKSDIVRDSLPTQDII